MFGLQGLPQWADWFYGKLDDNLAITTIHGLGCRPVLVTGTKQEFLGWLSEGIRKNKIQFPKSNGATAWPPMSVETMLSSQVTEIVQ